MVVLVGAVLGWHAAPAEAAIVRGQVDTFENGTTQGWSNGANNPSPASNVGTGGPEGVNDNYLRLSSNGGGAGGRLVAFNTAQWSGNYLAADVDAIQMQVNNFGSTALSLRLILVNLAAGQSLTTSLAVNVPAGSGWSTVSFPLVPQNLSGGSYDAVMANVSELNLVHSPNVIASRASAPPIVAQLGVDNITALPEPGLALGLVVMGVAAMQRRRGI